MSPLFFSLIARTDERKKIEGQQNQIVMFRLSFFFNATNFTTDLGPPITIFVHVCFFLNLKMFGVFL